MNHSMNHPGSPPDELVRVSADVVFHRDVLRVAVPGRVTACAVRDRLRVTPRDAQLALDFLDGMDENAC